MVCGRDHDGAHFLFDGLRGVDQNVDDHLLQALEIAFDFRDIPVQLQFHLGFSADLIGDQPQAALNDFIQIHLIVQYPVIPFGKLAQTFDDRLDAIGPLGHILQQNHYVAFENFVIQAGDLQVPGHRGNIRPK